MLGHVVKSAVLGVLGLAFGCGIVLFAVTRWTSLDTMWLNSALVWPILGLTLGLSLAEGSIGTGRTQLRVALTALAIPLCALGNYLAFVLTSRTWFADKIPADQQSFAFQVMHPEVLPNFFHTQNHGSMEWGWTGYLLLGLVAGPIIFWRSSRSPMFTTPR